MFGFLSMMGNYEDRKVDRYFKNGLLVSTAAVTDSTQPYETAVEHPKYNKGEIVIVEMYADLKAAKAGHLRWVKTMTARKLPRSLKDVSTCEIAKMIDQVSKKPWREKKAVKV